MKVPGKAPEYVKKEIANNKAVKIRVKPTNSMARFSKKPLILL